MVLVGQKTLYLFTLIKTKLNLFKLYTTLTKQKLLNLKQAKYTVPGQNTFMLYIKQKKCNLEQAYNFLTVFFSVIQGWFRASCQKSNRHTLCTEARQMKTHFFSTAKYGMSYNGDFKIILFGMVDIIKTENEQINRVLF